MTEILHLSTFLRRPIFDSDGDRIGRVQDLVARLGDDAHPPIVGVVIRLLLRSPAGAGDQLSLSGGENVVVRPASDGKSSFNRNS
jgi:hypothetical protein